MGLMHVITSVYLASLSQGTLKYVAPYCRYIDLVAIGNGHLFDDSKCRLVLLCGAWL